MAELEIISAKIIIIRGVRAVIDSELAQLYGVETKRLNEACRRNIEKFPEDFRFQLTRAEVENLRSQIATLPEKQGFTNLKSQIATSKKVGRTYLPYVFTEHGAIMAANLLRSPQAIDMSIRVVRAFVAMRQMIHEIKQLEEKYITGFENVYETIRKLILPPEEKKKKIGFL